MSVNSRVGTSPSKMVESLYKNRQLIFELVRYEVLGRYRGSIIGLAWSFLNPLFMLAIYTFFFSVVLKARWQVNTDQSQGDIAIILFVGLIIHSFFAECITRAPLSISGNKNYVKKIIFPLEILPCVALGSALFHSIISLFAMLMVQVFLGAWPTWTVVFFPLILFPLILITLGVAWFLASAGAYLKDISQMTTFLTSVLLFASPIFYPLSILPPKFQALVLLNPLTFIIEQARKVVIFGELPDFYGLLIYTICSMFVAASGFWWFQKMRAWFSDVL